MDDANGMDDDDAPLMTRDQTAAFLTRQGYPITTRTLANYASQGIGPKPAAYWGRKPLHGPRKTLKWAKGRLRPAIKSAAA
jgi:hypothetical protein